MTTRIALLLILASFVFLLAGVYLPPGISYLFAYALGAATVALAFLLSSLTNRSR